MDSQLKIRSDAHSVSAAHLLRSYKPQHADQMQRAENAHDEENLEIQFRGDLLNLKARPWGGINE